MGRSTPMLLPPTIDEAIQAGDKIGLPRLESMKFFAHHESKGWMIGKVRMKSLAGALQTWRFNWLERTGQIDANGDVVIKTVGDKKLTPMEQMIHQKELERVMSRMDILRNGVESHATMREGDRDEFRKLKLRRDELRKQLGVMI